MLQKTFTVDFLTKKKKINEGEIPQYYVENSHPAIISSEIFNLAQYELKKRNTSKGYNTGGSIFSSKIVCGECGSYYGSKVWHSTSKYRRIIWQCNHKFNNVEKCQTPHFYDETLKQAFIGAFNSIIENKVGILQGYEEIIKTLTDTTYFENNRLKIQGEYNVTFENLRKCVEENAHSALDQEDYQKRYNALVKQYEDTKNKLTELEDRRLDRDTKCERITSFMKTLKGQDGLINEFDDGIWNATVETVTIHLGQDITFTFKNGTELTWKV